MSKEQFDHVENRIREAAENSVPPFDEEAWANMEKKLDNEKSGKRRFFIWWTFAALLILSLGTGGYLIFKHIPNKKNPSLVNNTGTSNDRIGQPTIIATTPTTSADNKKETATTNISPVNKKIGSNPVVNITPGKSDGNKGAQHDKEITSPVALLNNQTVKKTKGRARLTSHSRGAAIADTDEANNNDLTKNDTGIADTNNANKTSSPVITAPKNVTSADTAKQSKAAVKIEAPKSKTGNDVVAATVKKQTIKESPSRFYFLASIGADAAGVKLLSFKSSTITPKYGIGIGYQLYKKLSLQTGFYVSTKKYVAGPNDYNAKNGSYWYTVQIIKVNASCLVYEIPLALRYDILQKSSFKIYATTGLSSFIMKREDYDYHFIRDNMYHESGWTYTGNKKLFSNLTFSAGIEKKLSKVLSLTAEPSVSIPIAGVGDGRVKLYSTALQVGLKYLPFKKSHKK